MLSEQSLIVVAEGLIAADLGSEAVVLDGRSGRYYGLNEVGLRVFELAREARSLAEIVTVLSEEFEVDPEMVMPDVMAFLEEMLTRRLVEVRNGAAAAA